MAHWREQQIRKQICEAGRRLYAKNHVAANDGNISVRISDQRILATPTGVCKCDLQVDKLAIVDLAGNHLGGPPPSTEIKMHLFAYRHRADVMAVVHAHPIYATAFATAGLSLDSDASPEVIVAFGGIPLAEYGTPSTDELPESLRPWIADHDAILLANHGALTVGKDAMDAYYKMERLEHHAQITFLARQLGGEKPLSPEQILRLQGLRGFYGVDRKS